MALGQGAGYGYICSRWVATGEGLCVTVRRARAEAAVLDWLADYAAEVEEAAGREASRVAAQLVARTGAEQLHRQIARLDERLTKLTTGWTDGLVPDAAYAASRDELTAQREGLLARAREAESEGRALDGPAMPVVIGLLEEWDDLPTVALNATLRQLIRQVTVYRSGRRGVPSTIVVVPRVELDA